MAARIETGMNVTSLAVAIGGSALGRMLRNWWHCPLDLIAQPGDHRADFVESAVE
jgi:hypothetical protein